LEIIEEAFMGEIIIWITANWSDLLQTVLAILGAASLVAKFTPTTLDDKWIGKIINLAGLTKK